MRRAEFGAAAARCWQLELTGASTVPYGALEASIELASVVGALCAAPVEDLVRTRPGGFLAASSLALAGSLAGAAAGAECGLVSVPFALNVLAWWLFNLQRAAGSSALARAVVGSSDRLPVLFAANTFWAYAGAALLNQIGAAAGWLATPYYLLCAALMARCAISNHGACSCALSQTPAQLTAALARLASAQRMLHSGL